MLGNKTLHNWFSYCFHIHVTWYNHLPSELGGVAGSMLLPDLEVLFFPPSEKDKPQAHLLWQEKGETCPVNFRADKNPARTKRQHRTSVCERPLTLFQISN